MKYSLGWTKLCNIFEEEKKLKAFYRGVILPTRILTTNRILTAWKMITCALFALTLSLSPILEGCCFNFKILFFKYFLKTWADITASFSYLTQPSFLGYCTAVVEHPPYSFSWISSVCWVFEYYVKLSWQYGK